MPKRKQGKSGIVLSLLAVAILSVPALSGIAAGATALPGIAKFIGESRKDSPKDTTTVRRMNESRDVGKNAQLKQESPAATVKSSPATASVDQMPPTNKAPSATLAAAKITEPTESIVAPADSATQSAQLARYQSDKSVEPVIYQTARIDTDQRDELLHASIVIAGAAALLYALSYAGVLWRLFYGDPVPNRRTITQ